MNLYQLAYSDYESFCPVLFSHNENKTQDEFMADVDSLLKKYGDEYLDTADGWMGVDDWMYYILPKMPELGYAQLNPICYSLWGSSILDDDRDIQEARWVDKVGIELCNKVIQKNQILRQTEWVI